MGIWWRIEAKVKEEKGGAQASASAAQALAALARDGLSAHKPHFAEPYSFNQGHLIAQSKSWKPLEGLRAP